MHHNAGNCVKKNQISSVNSGRENLIYSIALQTDGRTDIVNYREASLLKMNLLLSDLLFFPKIEALLITGHTLKNKIKIKSIERIFAPSHRVVKKKLNKEKG